jgi:hypothetical protein
VNDSDFIKLERLSEEDIIGTSKQGLLEQYLSLSREREHQCRILLWAEKFA